VGRIERVSRIGLPVEGHPGVVAYQEHVTGILVRLSTPVTKTHTVLVLAEDVR
jgi:hypothetical protein